MNSSSGRRYFTNKLRQFSREISLGALSRGVPMLVSQWREGRKSSGDSSPQFAAERAEEYLTATMKWLGQAQDARPDGGISAYFSLYGGFGPSYLETTGYIIPTLIAYSRSRGKPEYFDRASRATQWLIELQDKSGGFPSGFAAPEDDLAVFDTGQILFGLLAAAQSGVDRAMDSATRAGRWLAEVQEREGHWVRYAYEGRPHVYYTMVAWALAQLAVASDDAQVRAAALANARWAASQQLPVGTFDQFNLGNRPTFLHFMAYTLQGLIEVGRRLDAPELIDAAERGSRPLLQQLATQPTLAGAYDKDWRPTATYECVTGLAQMSLVFQALAEVKWPEYRTAAWQLNRRIRQTISLDGPPEICGAVKGSEPIWGKYLRFRYPNWAAKFYADAQMGELS
ncbi:MAG: terpene cyclase/mutase family protein [Planctomycetales bacterium]|nr:terpene cyclase/mutase family protein [Planctomycetales bacterium]MCA9169631.1 terpene cyclase/mutase family protein [Planctomycetales bacterium]